ncbi:MAG TPA: carboxymuconolactone decarboxylase family protein [Thermoanaerobaculia bacterium]|nr:carboxymuconolactone decarboxylase family protein [Thermoanaerobaculia bacterium]
MKRRLDYKRSSPGGYKAMLALNKFVETCGLERSLLELIKTRASQINGCAYCLDMHTRDARAAGETEQRLYVLDAWREAPFYTDRERAALAWTEAVTLLHQTHVPDDVYEETRKHFSETEIVNLTWAIVTINGWNRVAVSFRSQPGE